GPSAYAKSFQAAYVDDDGGKGQALDETGDHVAKLDRDQHVVQIDPQTQMGAEKHEERACENATDVGENAQAGYRDKRGQILGRQNEFTRLEAHDLKGVDLFGHHHGADLRGECGSRPPTDRNGGEKRPQFARKPNCDEIDNIMQGSEAA